jgi:sugar O-acyltransferase (sialic acid O-acetyltransferase NeuD family)
MAARPEIVVLGAIGNAIDVAEAILESGAYTLKGFLDDDPARAGATIAGAKVLGPLAAVRGMPGCAFVNAIGGPRSFRAKPALIARLGVEEARFATVVHARAWVSPSARLGPGCVVLSGCTINANAKLGAHAMLLPNCVVGHDSTVGDHAIFAAGVVVSGGVSIGANCYLGAGAVLRDGVRVGGRTLIGMGAAVTVDAPADAVVAGVPAKVRS